MCLYEEEQDVLKSLHLHVIVTDSGVAFCLPAILIQDVLKLLHLHVIATSTCCFRSFFPHISNKKRWEKKIYSSMSLLMCTYEEELDDMQTSHTNHVDT